MITHQNPTATAPMTTATQTMPVMMTTNSTNSLTWLRIQRRQRAQ